MDFAGLGNVVAITAIAYILAEGVKNVNKIDNKWIPTFCGVLGMVLGVIALYIQMPGFPATDVITAAAVGGGSGFAATGIHQMGKQLFFSDDESA